MEFTGIVESIGGAVVQVRVCVCVCVCGGVCMRSLIGRLLLINENKWFSSAQNRSRRRQRSRGERLEQSRREDPWTHRHRHTSTLTVFFPREKQRSYGIDYWLINQPQSCNQWRSVTLLLLLPPPRRPWIPERVWSVRSWWSETVSAGKLRCFTCSPRTVSLRWESSSDHRSPSNNSPINHHFLFSDGAFTCSSHRWFQTTVP